MFLSLLQGFFLQWAKVEYFTFKEKNSKEENEKLKIRVNELKKKIGNL